MSDPLADIVTLLQPQAPFSKTVAATGAWRIRRAEAGRPFYCAILEGGSRLEVDGHEPIVLQAGDFVLIPAAQDFVSSSLAPPPADAPDSLPVALPDGTFRIGPSDEPPDLRMLVGYCAFGSPDAALLVPLLPALVHVRSQARLATLVRLVADEARAQRPVREIVLARLLEVLLIEALRSTEATGAAPGLLSGLSDPRLASAIRLMHGDPARAWTVGDLAAAAALSRSAFFERFSRSVGVAPMEYLLTWRMALAKSLLRRRAGSVAEIAARVGYGSASAFSVAFSRHVGLPPTLYAREPS
ncbi:AraC family transcriptional regulator [Segnochrobactrum spirostomi]|uniref:AraC family transcriptional regulator n=1 Tax=Segnochrobactrum spirostomi TaxID=2608987 RepID=A0A6A7Y9B9_9HYPH|nr:AraC family transcriptional regulator [Segnochrobactrum spirostomi]MQT14571.1 AraC family transcriptional regulator [Segnochrobactrum spirostomi]